MKTNNAIIEVEVYESPKCQVISLESESTILSGSVSSTHEGFEEDEYIW